MNEMAGVPPASPSECAIIAILRLVLLALYRQQPGRWAVVVSSGGHFAAAVFAMAPAAAGRQQPKVERHQLEVVAHKTVHRYVVR